MKGPGSMEGEARMVRAVRWCVLPVAAMLLAACGGDDDATPAAIADDDGTDPSGFDVDDLDMSELTEQLEELGRAAEEFELEAVEQDPDRPLLLPADVQVTGDLEGTYTDNPGCAVEAQYVDPDDGYHEDVLAVRFGWAGHAVDWTSELPDDPRPLSVLVHAPGFAGAGSYDAFVTLAGVEVWAVGSAQLTVVELRREEFPTGEVVVLEGEVSGSWSGEVGTGEILGDIGVCNVRMP